VARDRSGDGGLTALTGMLSGLRPPSGLLRDAMQLYARLGQDVLPLRLYRCECYPGTPATLVRENGEADARADAAEASPQSVAFVLHADIGLPAAAATFARVNGLDPTLSVEAVAARKDFKFAPTRLSLALGLVATGSGSAGVKRAEIEARLLQSVSVSSIPRPSSVVRGLRPSHTEFAVCVQVCAVSLCVCRWVF
jgi:hypothetical protein